MKKMKYLKRHFELRMFLFLTIFHFKLQIPLIP